MNAFSTDTAKEIFASYPEWKAYARQEKDEDGSAYLFIEIPAPQPADTDHGLTISTYDNEITVSFDFYHSHFDSWRDRGQAYGEYAALPFVQELLSETTAVASWWDGERWCGSRPVSQGEGLTMSHIQPFTRIRVRSWNGTRNEDRPA